MRGFPPTRLWKVSLHTLIKEALVFIGCDFLRPIYWPFSSTSSSIPRVSPPAWSSPPSPRERLVF